jgi:hypothetical protein
MNGLPLDVQTTIHHPSGTHSARHQCSIRSPQGPYGNRTNAPSLSTYTREQEHLDNSPSLTASRRQAFGHIFSQKLLLSNEKELSFGFSVDFHDATWELSLFSTGQLWSTIASQGTITTLESCSCEFGTSFQSVPIRREKGRL